MLQGLPCYCFPRRKTDAKINFPSSQARQSDEIALPDQPPSAAGIAAGLRELAGALEQRRGTAAASATGPELERIVVALRTLPDATDVVTQASRCLRVAIASSRGGSAAACEAGAAEALVASLQQLPQPSAAFASDRTATMLFGNVWRALSSLVCEEPGLTAPRVAAAGAAVFALRSIPRLAPMRPVLPFAVSVLTHCIQSHPGCRAELLAAGAAQARLCPARMLPSRSMSPVFTT